MIIDSLGKKIINRRNCCVIVSDFDRTLTEDSSELYGPLLGVLSSLRRYENVKFLVASGRKLDFLLKGFDLHNSPNAIVAENGGVIYSPDIESIHILGEQDARIREQLKNSSIPFDAGQVVISIRKEFEIDVIKLVKGMNPSVRIEHNRDSIMILPSNVDKAHGVNEALRLMRLQPRELICIGDAENDYSLFDIGTVSVATYDAVPELKGRADIVCSEKGAVGVTRFLSDLLESIHKNDEPHALDGV
jgi:hypothetical protein